VRIEKVKSKKTQEKSGLYHWGKTKTPTGELKLENKRGSFMNWKEKGRERGKKNS